MTGFASASIQKLSILPGLLACLFFVDSVSAHAQARKLHCGRPEERSAADTVGTKVTLYEEVGNDQWSVEFHVIQPDGQTVTQFLGEGIQAELVQGDLTRDLRDLRFKIQLDGKRIGELRIEGTHGKNLKIGKFKVDAELSQCIYWDENGKETRF